MLIQGRTDHLISHSRILPFLPVEMRCVARKNDHCAGRLDLQLTRDEFITQSDMKDAGNHGLDETFLYQKRYKPFSANVGRLPT